MSLCQWCNRPSGNTTDGLCLTCHDNKQKMNKNKVLICQWCFEEPAVESKTVCQACLEEIEQERAESKEFDLDRWLDDTEEGTAGRESDNRD